MKKSVLTIMVVLLLSGCSLFSAFTPTTIVRHPDAPMLILEVKGEYAKVAIYSRALGTLIEAGWVELKVLVGWTVFKHNWAPTPEKLTPGR